MALYAEKTGRSYQPYSYIGDPDAEKIIIAMGSATETIEETINYLNSRGEKVGRGKSDAFPSVFTQRFPWSDSGKREKDSRS